MTAAQVARLPPQERFLYWIRERHRIYLAKLRGEPPPWTDDEVLRSYWFTNPYREHDKVTAWFRENVRGPLRDKPEVLFATVAFRWFNVPNTGLILKDLLTDWDEPEARNRLALANAAGPVFTGAYMIKSRTGVPKIRGVCECISNVWRDRHELVGKFEAATTLEEAHGHLLGYPYLGGFMAYEIVTDLRHTYLLENATDKMAWCNPGPGCKRGLLRLGGMDAMPKNKHGRQKRGGIRLPDNWLGRMAGLLDLCNERLHRKEGMPKFEMREIEHSLCEWDKFERARLGDGKMKRRYNGGG